MSQTRMRDQRLVVNYSKEDRRRENFALARLFTCIVIIILKNSLFIYFYFDASTIDGIRRRSTTSVDLRRWRISIINSRSFYK